MSRSNFSSHDVTYFTTSVGKSNHSQKLKVMGYMVEIGLNAENVQLHELQEINHMKNNNIMGGKKKRNHRS